MRSRKRSSFVVLATIACLGWLPAAARAADAVAYVTEIHRAGRDEVAVKQGGAGWKMPQPLLALRPGDQVRATGGARVVILYHGGGGTQAVTAANSPFTVAVAPAGGSGEQFKVVAGAVSEFFLGKQGPPTFRRAATRGEPTTLLSPRHTRLFPGPVTFEWEGAEHLRYTVRLLGPEGVIWQQADLPRRPVAYPPAAPSLRPGVRYLWELEAPGQPVQRTQFEILSEADAARVRSVLAVLDSGTRDSYSRGTVVVMRSSVLFEEGLFVEARRELETAAAMNREEPTLRFLLGHLYSHIGLDSKAGDAFEEAKRLSGQ